MAIHTQPALLTALLVFTVYSRAQTQFTPKLTTLANIGGSPGGLTIGTGPSGHTALFGTTYSGGGLGTVYSLTPPASPGDSWTQTVLHTFTGSFSGGDGSYPIGVLAIGKGGVLYGATRTGGTNTRSGCGAGCGTVYSLTPPASASGSWTYAVIYNFTSASFWPSAGVVIGPGGVLYGATEFGGVAPYNGTVFAFVPPAAPGSPWTYSVLHNFTGGSDGGGTVGLALGSNGVLFGTTSGAGIASCTVFSLTPPAAPGDAWTLDTLYNFANGNLSIGPSAPTIGPNGLLYGTTTYGGNPACSGIYGSGCGTVFAVTPPSASGGSWVFTTIYNFTGGNDGYWPYGGVMIGPNGLLYGTANDGGTAIYYGTIYSLTPPTSSTGSSTETTLYGFTGYPNGSNPEAGVVFGASGVLYGTVEDNGGCQEPGCGAVYSLTM